MKERILLIEDNAPYAEALRQRLAPFADVDVAPTLTAGIHQALSKDYWCILLDLTLPDSNWPNTFNTFAEITRSASVVIVSGQDSPEFVAETIRAGAAGYIVKGRDDLDGEQIFGAICRAVLHKESLNGLEHAARIAHDTQRINKNGTN